MGERSRTRSDRCEHRSLASVEPTKGGYRLRCAVCGKAGPVRKTPEAARKALLVLGARDGVTQTGTGPNSRPTHAPPPCPRG
jgi:hypothetical protein